MARQLMQHHAYRTMASGSWLVFAGCLLVTFTTSGSARTATDTGICTRFTQYVAGEGKRVTDGATTTYCANERDCSGIVSEVCCKGWKRDPNSKILRCIKINDTATSNINTLDVTTDVRVRLENADDPAVVRKARDTPKKASVANSGNADRDSVSSSSNDGSGAVSDTQQAGKSSVSAGTPSEKESVGGTGNTNNLLATKTASTPTTNGGATTKDSSGKTVDTVASRRSVGQTGSGASPDDAASEQNNRPAVPASDGKIDSDSRQSSTIGTPPVEHGSSGTGLKADSIASVPASATNNNDSPHGSPKQDGPSPGGSTDGSGTRQERLNKGASTSGSNEHPAGSTSQHQAVPHDVVAPTVKHSESKEDADKNSNLAHTTEQSQISAKNDHNDAGPLEVIPPPGGASQSSGSVTVAPTAVSMPMVTSTTPRKSRPSISQTDDTGASRVQPQSDTSAPNSVGGVTAVVATTRKTTESKTTTMSTTARVTTGSVVATAPTMKKPTAQTDEHSDQSTSSTVLTTRDGAGLSLGEELEHGRLVDTIPLTDPMQATTGPTIPISVSSTITSTTTAPKTMAVSDNATSSQPQIVSTTLRAPNGAHVHTELPPARGDTTTAPSQSTIRDGTKPGSIAVPASEEPSHQKPNNTHKDKVPEKTDDDNRSSKEAPTVTNSKQGASSAPNLPDNNAANTNATNCTMEGNKMNCSGVNCTPTAHWKNCNATNAAVPVANSSLLPVAKSLGEDPAEGNALPSGSSTSKTASEVTISLLLVAAIAFVAALLYWRTRRRRQRYINCGTREPNLHFTNPVYDLEEMMEQTSFVKLQNAVDIEDDNVNNSHGGTPQRK